MNTAVSSSSTTGDFFGFFFTFGFFGGMHIAIYPKGMVERCRSLNESGIK
jgi:hypothetical protein